MIFAGHYPRQNFTAAELLVMPVYKHGCGDLSQPGWNRSTDSRGKPLAFYSPHWPDDTKPHCVVRPIVRVKATTRVIRDACCNKTVSFRCRGV